jgi:hypothetical protein
MRPAGVALVVLGALLVLAGLLAVPTGETVQAAVSSPVLSAAPPTAPAPTEPDPVPTSPAPAAPPDPAPASPAPPALPRLAPPAARAAVTRPAPAAARTAVTQASPPAPPAPRLRPRPSRPAIDADVPDPDIVHVGGTWLAYATGSGFFHLQVRASPDLRSWGAPADALPRLPVWASPGVAWGPAVLFIGGQFRLYYSARDAALGRECLSVAASTTAAGPFVDSSAAPLTCQRTSGGSIDPQPFVGRDGTPYLLWKSEDNALGSASRIGAQQLTPDGLALVGPRPRLLMATARWQAGVVEGPSMVAADGGYYLFYGANHWDTAAAAIGYAVCASPLGPCRDATPSRPWLASWPGGWGPSGPDVFVGPDGADELAFHAWNGPPGRADAARALWIAPLTFVDGVPVLG